MFEARLGDGLTQSANGIEAVRGVVGEGLRVLWERW